MVNLTGKKRICGFVGRSWDTIYDWIQNREFPAAKISGVWESDQELIIKWKQKMIQECKIQKPVK